MTSVAEFYAIHEELIHELVTRMFDANKPVMEWFALRSDNEIIVLMYFAVNLPDVTRLLTLSLLQQAAVRNIDLYQKVDPAKL